jgi:nucleotide-binding universal stress UspA family protein
VDLEVNSMPRIAPRQSELAFVRGSIRVEENGRRDVLVGVDGSRPSLTAVRWAAREASLSGRRLRVLHAYQWRPPARVLADTVDELMEEHARLVVDRAVDEARAAAPGIAIGATMIRTAPVVALLDAAGEASLVVVSSRGRGGHDGLLLGSVALQLAADAPCSVAIIRGHDDRTAGPVVVGVNGSNLSRVALGLAFEQAAARNCAVLAAFAHLTPLDVEHELVRTVTAWREKYPEVPVDHLLTGGRPGEVLTTLSNRARVVVVGRRDRGSLTGPLLDSTSRQLFNHADCPILIAHA